MSQATSPARKNALKTALKRVVADLGGLAAAASCTRVGVSQLSDYGNIESDKMVPVDVVFDLEFIAGQPHITAVLANALGYDLVPSDAWAPHELVACLARISDDNGRLFSLAVQALRAGRMNAADRSQMLSDLNDVERATREAKAALAMQGGDEC